MSKKLSGDEVIAICIEMHGHARRLNGVARRISYTQYQRERAIGALNHIEAKGGNLDMASDMMGVQKQTLKRWLSKATEPDSDWKILYFKQS